MADVVVGYLHPGTVSHSFHQSARNLMLWDQAHDNRIMAWFSQEQGAGGIANGRNAVVREFLTTEAEWLMFIDADMGFEADALDRLLEEADPRERPILGGLAFAQHIGSQKEAGAKRFLINPTIYTWTGDGVKPVIDYLKDEVVECDATGAAFLLIHRGVLETLSNAFQPPYNWFAETLYKGKNIGEDITFCRRAVGVGYPIHAHTGVKTSHHKQAYVDEEFYNNVKET